LRVVQSRQSTKKITSKKKIINPLKYVIKR